MLFTCQARSVKERIYSKGLNTVDRSCPLDTQSSALAHQGLDSAGHRGERWLQLSLWQVGARRKVLFRRKRIKKGEILMANKMRNLYIEMIKNYSQSRTYNFYNMASDKKEGSQKRIMKRYIFVLVENWKTWLI